MIRAKGYIDDNGELRLDNRSEFNRELKHHKGKKVRLLLEEDKKQRSNAQLRYWFGVILKMISDYINETTGEETTPEEWHEYYIKKQYFGVSIKQINGEMIIIENRSAKTNTTQFKEVCERLQVEWATRGLILPDPNQTAFMDYYGGYHE